MARQALIEREKKRERLCNKYKNKRAELKSIIKNPNMSMDEKFKASLSLSKLPRNSAKIRQRNRCKIDGRPRGYMRKFGMSRLWFRKYASSGEMPGIKKASW